MRNVRIRVLFVAVALALAFTAKVARAEPHRVINEKTPGQAVDIAQFVVKGKVNVFDFYSRFCGPCMRLSPYLEQLAQKEANVAVNKVDINRPGTQGIDWDSPAAKQYKLHSIPYFMVFDAQGKKVAEGDDARKMVLELLQKAGIH